MEGLMMGAFKQPNFAILLLSSALALLTCGTSNAGVTTYGYDEMDRLTRTDYDNGSSIIYSYDEIGNLLADTRFSSIPNDGDLNGDGRTTVLDVMIALRISTGNVSATASDLAHGDVAPLADGKPSADGAITIADAQVLLQKAVGLITW